MNPFDTDANGKEFFVHHSQIGRALSHRVALGAAISHGFSEFIIAEEDVFFCEDFASKWAVARGAFPPDLSVVQLQFLKDNIQLERLNDYVSRSRPFPFCTTCIWWRAEAARKAITTLWAFDRPYDIMLIQRVYPQLKHAVTEPPLAFRWADVQKA
jgi:GR25 family glycosyltransferase involved in LPS biosynthesis